MSSKEQSSYEKEIKKLTDQLNKIDQSVNLIYLNKFLVYLFFFQFQMTKDHLNEYKSENANLCSKIQTLNDEKSQLYDKLQQLEIQLVQTNEKHRVCQLEVTQKDQSIIKVKTDLNLINEKYSSTLDEIRIQQEEIDRLNQRVTKQSTDLKEMQDLNDKLDDKNCQKDKLLKQYEYELEQVKQEVAKKEKQIEIIKSDWTMNIRNHEEEIKGYKQSYQILSEELNRTKSDLADFMNKITNLKQKINELSEGLECKNTENSGLRSEIERYEQLTRENEAKICQLSSDLCVTRSYYDNNQNELENLSIKFHELQERYQTVLSQLDDSERECKAKNEQIIELRFSIAQKEQSIEELNSQNLKINQILNEKCADLKKFSQENDNLNEQIEKVNQEYNKLIQLMEQSESALQVNQEKLNEKTDDVSLF